MKYSRWGILAVIVLFGMLVSACGSAAQPATPAPTPIPGPALACKGDVCIRQVFATMTDDALQIAFDLSDKNSNVELGKPPEFTGDIYVSAHRLDKEGKDDFVFAVGIPQGTYGCYSGNDLPWTGGELGGNVRVRSATR